MTVSVHGKACVVARLLVKMLVVAEPWPNDQGKELSCTEFRDGVSAWLKDVWSETKKENHGGKTVVVTLSHDEGRRQSWPR